MTFLVFLDTGVDNNQQLFDSVVAEAQPFLIDTVTNGLQQIDEILQQCPGSKTVQIISHGVPGCLCLGNTHLSLDTLKHYIPQLQLCDIDNLMLYGCHIAAGDAGEEFMGKLSGLIDPHSSPQGYYKRLLKEEGGLQPLLLIRIHNNLCNIYFYF